MSELLSVPLDQIRALADGILGIPDDRPRWMIDLSSANDEGQTQFARYYRFFYEFVKSCKPENVLEIGTYHGTSAAHLAYADPSCKVVTMDIEPSSIAMIEKIAMDHNLNNVTTITGDSFRIFSNAERFGPYDVLFIDAVHDFVHCYGEYLLYRPLVREGGIIFFDDIHLGSEMDAAWDLIADPKIELPTLHYTGFGACKVDSTVTPRAIPSHPFIR